MHTTVVSVVGSLQTREQMCLLKNRALQKMYYCIVYMQTQEKPNLNEGIHICR